MGAPNIFYTTLALTVSLFGFIFGNTLFDGEDPTDVRQSITAECYSIAEEAQKFYGKLTLLGADGRSYPDIRLTQCDVEMTDNGYRGETDVATFFIEGDFERFTVTGVSKSDCRQTVVLSCFMDRADGNRYSVVTANW